MLKRGDQRFRAPCLSSSDCSQAKRHAQPTLIRFNRRFYPFNAFRFLLGIAGDVTAPTYAELYAKKARPTTSSGLGS